MQLQLATTDEERNKIKNIIFENNIKLAQKFAVKRCTNIVNYQFKDVYSIASFALWKSIDKFDLSLGYSFSNWAYNCMLHDFADQRRVLDGWTALMYYRTVSKLLKNGEEPTFERICEEMNAKPWVVASISFDGSSIDNCTNDCSYSTIALHQSIEEGWPTVYFNNIKSDILNPEEFAILRERKEIVMKFLEPECDVLKEIEKEILRKILVEGKSQSDIARELEVTRKNINFHYTQAIHQIQTHLKFGKFCELYNQLNYKQNS